MHKLSFAAALVATALTVALSASPAIVADRATSAQVQQAAIEAPARAEGVARA